MSLFNASIFNAAIFNTGETPEIADISNAFVADCGPIHLLAHEARQLKRIRSMAARDAKRAAAAMRLFLSRARTARRAIRPVRPEAMR